MLNQGNKQARGEKTQKKILETGLRLFAKKGFDKVTVDEICKESGTSKGSFYQHFSSKSTLFLVKFSEADEHYMQVFNSLPKEMDIYKKIELFVHEVMCFLNDQMGKELMKVIYSSALLSKEHTYFLNKDRGLTIILRSLAAEVYQQHPGASEQQVENLLTMMNQAMMGMIYHWGVSQCERTLQDLSSYMIGVLVEGVKSSTKHSHDKKDGSVG
ncbi:TetR/AcrR family transcriptional regulator [Microbacterium sp. APC 3898]|uniref:TetR/AcrR family transcriptional regulator n=1 Tax=Planococcus notacanthi TaxID=3035188 RepID=A0ABT7ZEW0_9BACL|nr:MULTISPECIES: TetR/AcrR family transcriptional regulator [Terrabacteria group]MDN3425690.1 TetR/AcrR family transcriptional regulator [Planococcus sp. APC 4016]MDN3501028.1 TetR/AcrR family transcriptional regulator [Microbacterium sp. APC 3898]